MPTTSTVPAVRLALVELIRDAVGNDVQVEYGEPKAWTRDERIVVGDTSGLERERSWPQLGATPRTREERYALAITVTTTRPGKDQQQATERAYELFGLIEEAHIEAPTLGVSGVIVTGLEQPEDFDVAANAGAGSQIESALLVQARITRSSS